ncbi:hypothetical protein VE04_05544 [Pseudogymnoascus sp. 24MN13]|nr:hypothetical protein VE04_05544 [Pseudogymnoascus sp. 24MN13]
MARLNATSTPVPVASKQNQDEEEVAEDGDWEQFVYAERTKANSRYCSESNSMQNKKTQKKRTKTRMPSGSVLNVLNNATSTPRTSSRALQDDEPQQDPPFSIRKRVTGLFTEGLRLLGSSGSRPNDNDITDDTSPAKARDDNMQLRSTSASAIKAPNKLSRPSVLHQPLNTYKPSPQGSGKPDVYDLHASPEKAATTPTRTQSKQAQGVKRKRNNTAAAKKPPPKGKAPSPHLLVTVSKESEQIKAEAPTRVTRSRGSGEIVEPIDYSRKVEDTGKRKRSGGTVDVEPPPRASRKRNKKVIEDEVDESEDGDRPSTPGNQNLAEEDIPAAEAASPPTLQKPHVVDELPEATPSVSDKGSQSGAASGPSDATAKSIKKGKNATVEDKEDPDDQDFEDSGSGVEYSGSEEELEPESEEEAESKTEEELKPKTEGISPTNTAIPRRKRQGELQVSIKSPYFGNDFIAASNIIKVTELVDKLGMNQPKDTQNDTEPLRKADTFDGKEIQVLTRNIISSYESIQGLDEHEDPDPVARTEALCSAARDLDRLEVTVRRIIEKKLCDPAKLAARYGGDKGEKWRKRMLKDLFLFVMPDIIRAASAAIFTYGSEGPPGTFDLKEILRYISLVSRLLVIVEDPNNKDHRPVAAHNAALPIRRPYMSIKPLLLGFEIQCKQELQHREDVAEAERQAPILERERREREEAERLAAEEAEIEHQRRQEEINNAYNQERMKYGLAPVPLAGTQVSQKPLPSDPSRPTEPHQAQELNITAHRIRAEEELRGYDADDAHEVDYERVEMFPAGNNNAPVTEPWTKTEYEVLADGLRLETGPDKYPNIARRLDRSFDEIFEKALEFKRVIIETLYVPKGIPVPAWIEIIGNEMLPRGRE